MKRVVTPGESRPTVFVSGEERMQGIGFILEIQPPIDTTPLFLQTAIGGHTVDGHASQIEHYTTFPSTSEEGHGKTLLFAQFAEPETLQYEDTLVARSQITGNVQAAVKAAEYGDLGAIAAQIANVLNGNLK